MSSYKTFAFTAVIRWLWPEFKMASNLLAVHDWQWSKKCSNAHLCSWDFFPWVSTVQPHNVSKVILQSYQIIYSVVILRNISSIYWIFRKIDCKYLVKGVNILIKLLKGFHPTVAPWQPWTNFHKAIETSYCTKNF